MSASVFAYFVIVFIIIVAHYVISFNFNVNATRKKKRFSILSALYLEYTVLRITDKATAIQQHKRCFFFHMLKERSTHVYYFYCNSWWFLIIWNFFEFMISCWLHNSSKHFFVLFTINFCHFKGRTNKLKYKTLKLNQIYSKKQENIMLTALNMIDSQLI